MLLTYVGVSGNCACVIVVRRVRVVVLTNAMRVSCGGRCERGSSQKAGWRRHRCAVVVVDMRKGWRWGSQASLQYWLLYVCACLLAVVSIDVRGGEVGFLEIIHY